MKKSSLIPLLAVGALLVSSAAALPIVHNTDFIADGSRSGFNGFEGIPNDGTYFVGGAGPYVEGGIEVTQINGDLGNDIWVNYTFWAGVQGLHAWYPDGGDNGYTRIRRAGGVDFQSVGFNYGTGGSATLILFELYDNGSLVASGTAARTSGVNYLGFSGGGFDTILVRDSHTSSIFPVASGAFQALSLDNIEIQGGSNGVPESGVTAGMLASGLAALAALARRRSVARG